MADGCWCHRCKSVFDLGDPGSWPQQMTVCPGCGNKRCPRASDHRFECTNSNESGQPGSIYR